MIQKVFTIFDTKAGFHSPPMVFQTVGLAVRQFIELAEEPQSRISKWPADFVLFEIGDYDDVTGTMAPATEHKSHGNAASYLAQRRVVAETNGKVQG